MKLRINILHMNLLFKFTFLHGSNGVVLFCFTITHYERRRVFQNIFPVQWFHQQAAVLKLSGVKYIKSVTSPSQLERGFRAACGFLSVFTSVRKWFVTLLSVRYSVSITRAHSHIKLCPGESVRTQTDTRVQPCHQTETFVSSGSCQLQCNVCGRALCQMCS